MKKALLTGAALLATLAGSNAYAERDYISIVGSSTVYPFSTVVAERFGKSSSFPTPKVESTGSGGGMKLFCSGVVKQPQTSPTHHVRLSLQKSNCVLKMASLTLLK